MELKNRLSHNSEAENVYSAGLLDLLAAKAGCLVLSDLKFKSLIEIQYLLRKIHENDFSLKEWNDAVQYLTGKKIRFSTQKQAADYLREIKMDKIKD